MKQKCKATIALLLVFAIVLGLAACGGGGGGATETPGVGIGGGEQGTLEQQGYVFVPEFIDVRTNGETSLELLAISGGDLYVTYRMTEGAGGIGVLNADGTGFRSIWQGISEFWEEDDASHSDVQEVAMVVPHPEGGVLAVRYDYGGFWGADDSDFHEAFALMWIASDGTVRREEDLNDVLGIQEGFGFGVRRMQMLSDGRVLIGSWDTLYVLSADWTLERQMDLEVSDFIVAADDQMLVSVWREGADATQVFPFDLATGEIDESGDPVFEADLFQSIQGTQYDLYVGTPNAVFGFDMQTRRSTLLFDWLDIDMLNSSRFVPAENGDIFFFEQQWGDWEMGGSTRDTSVTLVRLVQRPVSEVSQRTEIVYGALTASWEIRQEIVNFNQRNQNYRIRLREYWNWMSNEPIADAIARLNTDIVTGNAPDIIDFGLQLPYAQYARRGVLADMGALIDGDSELSRDDFVQNVMDLMKIDGTLYTATSQFTVQTLAGRREAVGPDMGWTMDEFLAQANALPPDAAMFDTWITRQTFMSMIFAANLGQFIDRETGRAHFDSDLFRAYLEFARTLPTDEEVRGEDGMWPGDFVRPLPARAVAHVEREVISIEPLPPIGELPDEGWINPFATGQILLQDTTLFGFSTLMFMEDQFGGPVTFIGYPAEEGIGSVIVPQTMLGISATSRNIDAAWSFVRTILTPQYQRTNGFQFATNLTVLNEQMDEAMTPMFPGEGLDGSSAATQAQIDQIMALINQTSQLFMADVTVIDMITEETLPFFAGDRSVEETARIIQSRVQTYLSERG